VSKLLCVCRGRRPDVHKGPALPPHIRLNKELVQASYQTSPPHTFINIFIQSHSIICQSKPSTLPCDARSTYSRSRRILPGVSQEQNLLVMWLPRQVSRGSPPNTSNFELFQMKSDCLLPNCVVAIFYQGCDHVFLCQEDVNESTPTSTLSKNLKIRNRQVPPLLHAASHVSISIGQST
jgi:hypothetical protein